MPEDVFFIAKHPDLLGDPLLGPNEYLRFQPIRFNVKGEALDPRGASSGDLACPRCHLQIPDAMVEIPPLFISMIGSPASGKSYFLTTMSWELRRLMPEFHLEFSDADPVANGALHEYEHTLFMNPQPDYPTEIRKTQVDDPKLHRTATINGVPTRFPIPLQFRLWPMASHPQFEQAHKHGCLLVLYDNAGEDFLPGVESSNSAVVQHLAKSQILFMLFDPTQDPRFKVTCRKDDPQLSHGLRPGSNQPFSILRQETLLKEASVRIRRYLGISQTMRIKKPLFVIVPKFDLWEDMSGLSISEEPYIRTDSSSPIRIDQARIEKTDCVIREIFRKYCPEFVATAESLSEIVHYIPVSSLGCSPVLVKKDEQEYYGIKPQDIHPKWVSVPLTYCLSKYASGLIFKANE
jgi:hypothetical protein